MTKNLQHQETGISLNQNSKGCIRGIFHQFNPHKWHVRKMLPYKRLTGGKHTTTANGTDPTQRSGNSDAEKDKSAETKVTEHKTSMKSRIKAKISEEVSRRRGKHRRTSSEPTRTQPIETNNTIENPTTNHIPLKDEKTLEKEEDKVEQRLLDPVLPKVENESIDSNNGQNYTMRQSEDNMKDKQPVKDHILVQDNSISAIQPSPSASLQDSKLLLDALDLLNMREELFMKVLQDPNSSLSHQLSKSKSGLTKSESFPVPGPSRSTSENFNDEKCTQEAQSSANEAGNSTPEESNENLTSLALNRKDTTPEEVKGPINNTLHDIPNELKSRNENKIVLKKFKNLGEKIKHAIKESKKDRQRIVMDGVLHKIPHGWKSFKGHEKPIEICDKSSFKSKVYKRTSSLSEPLDKYNPLLESEFCKEAKDSQISEKSSLKVTNLPSPIKSSAKKLARILSLPDLKSFSPSQSTVSPVTTYSVTTVKIGEHKHSESCLSIENQSQIDSVVSERESQDNLEDARQSYDDLGALELAKSTSGHELSTKNKQISFSESEESRTSPLEEEEQLYELYIDSSMDIFQFQSEIKNKSEFEYVKDVLELSGLSKNEQFLGWHSAEQPVNPTVFNEVEECLQTSQPEPYENEVDGTCDHILLFDLINEVLLDIYGKSSSYWPMPLTCRSRIYHMPVGNYVLKDVWADISYYLRLKSEFDESLDDEVSRDLAKSDGWMNLQFDSECVGLELEEFMIDDLLEELLFDDLLEELVTL